MAVICLLVSAGWRLTAQEAADAAKVERTEEAEKVEIGVPPEGSEADKQEQGQNDEGTEEKVDSQAAEPPTEDEEAEEKKEAKQAEEAAKVARPVSSDPVQIYGWREWVTITNGDDQELRLQAKLDTGARTSSIHTAEKELFERDGKKWVRFVVEDTAENGDRQRMRMEAPLVRIARIKTPGGESETREVVRLKFLIGERRLKVDFTLNNRKNMLSPVLLGRRTISVLGWVDPTRAYLAETNEMR